MTLREKFLILFVYALCLLALPSFAGLSNIPMPGEAKRKAMVQQETAKATFAGGCFWCMEHPFDTLSGVLSTTSGYTGGRTKNPTYEQVSAGETGHAEAMEVVYDPKRINYERLLDVFWRNVDPLTKDAQFCDHGSQYRTAIFTHDAAQRKLAEESKRKLSGRFKEPIVTEIVPANEFYPAEDYHQDYYRKNPIRYKVYRWNCGRDKRLKELWGKVVSHDP